MAWKRDEMGSAAGGRSTCLQSAAVKFGRRHGEGECLVPDRIACAFPDFGFLLFDAFTVDHQIKFDHGICKWSCFRQNFPFLGNTLLQVTYSFLVGRYYQVLGFEHDDRQPLGGWQVTQ